MKNNPRTNAENEMSFGINAMVADGSIPAGKYKPSDLYTIEFSDLWVNGTALSPLNPYHSSKRLTIMATVPLKM